MPSPIQIHGGKKYYRRSDGAFILKKGRYNKVGCNAYKDSVHYSKRDIGKDRKYRATKSSKLRRSYPQQYD